MLAELADQNPAVKGNMMNALRNIKGTHLLDPKLLALQGGAPTVSASEDLI